MDSDFEDLESEVESDRRVETEIKLVDLLWPIVARAIDAIKEAPTSPDNRIRAFANAAGELACYLAFREEDRIGSGERDWDEDIFVEAFAEGWNDGWMGASPEKWKEVP